MIGVALNNKPSYLHTYHTWRGPSNQLSPRYSWGSKKPVLYYGLHRCPIALANPFADGSLHDLYGSGLVQCILQTNRAYTPPRNDACSALLQMPIVLTGPNSGLHKEQLAVPLWTTFLAGLADRLFRP